MHIFSRWLIRRGDRGPLLYFLLLFVALFTVSSLFYPWRQLYLSHLGLGLSDTLVFWSIALWLLIILYFYHLFFRSKVSATWRPLLVTFTFLCLALSLVWPLTSSDLYSYVYQARVWSVFGLNPYLHSYSALTQDYFFFAFNNHWSFRAAPYGPLFMILTGAWTYISHSSFLGSLLGLKIFLASLNVLVGIMIYRFRFSLFSFYLYAFNPLVLFEVAINGHNDIMLVFFLVLSLITALNSKKKPVFWSFLWLFFSVAVKYLSVVLIPIWIIIFWREAVSGRARCWLIVNILISGLVSSIFYWYFFPDVSNFIGSILNQGSFVNFIKSPLIGWIDTALSLFTFNHLNIAIIVSRAIFLIFYIYLLVRVWVNGTRVNLLYYSVLVFTVFLLTCFTWLMPWYLITPIALLSLLYHQEKYQRLAANSIFVLTFYGIITYFVLR